MENQKLSLDELFTKQKIGAQKDFLVTIEEIEENNDLILVTPWKKSSGCLCSLSFKLEKKWVESVTVIDVKHHCCKKVLEVVSINFNKDSFIPLDNLYNQIFEKLHSESTVNEHHHEVQLPKQDFVFPSNFSSYHNFHSPQLTQACPNNWPTCNGTCYNPLSSQCIGGIICPNGSQLCGTTCFNPLYYMCYNGKVCLNGHPC